MKIPLPSLKDTIPWAAFALVLVSAGVEYTAQQRQIGRSEVVAGQADSLLKIERQRGDSIAAVKKVDTLRLVQWATKYATVKAIPDTVVFHDTAYVTVEHVRTIVAAADSTINACHAVLNDCEIQRQVLAADTVLWRQKYVAETKLVPSGVKPWWDRLVGAAVGFGAASLVQALHR